MKLSLSVATKKALNAPGIANAVRQRAGQAIRATAFEVLRRAIQKAPVDTGFLANSGYVVTNGTNGYEAAKAAASAKFTAKNPQAVNAPGFTDSQSVSVPLRAIVAFGAEYARFVHDGAHNRAGVPYLTQAMEDERTAFEERVAKAIASGTKAGA